MSDETSLAWDVLLSTASTFTSPILRKKLGLQGGSTLVSTEAGGVEVRVGDEVGPSSPRACLPIAPTDIAALLAFQEELIDSEDIGLVIFEADPSPNW